MTEKIEIETIERLVVHPGETLVVTVPSTTSPAQFEYIRSVIEEKLPGIPVLVKTENVDLVVVAEAER